MVGLIGALPRLPCLSRSPQRVVDMAGELLALDFKAADQGWLRVYWAGADRVPLGAADHWTNPSQPTPEHSRVCALK